jgi:hypothetical protein
MNLAALKALLEGQLFNARAASTPGGIEAQEAAGQAVFVESDVLPRKIQYATREQLVELGFKFGKDTDELFVECQLPAGWAKRATNHAMWSELLDDKGRCRAMIFFKAAFYDRSAEMTMYRRFKLDLYDDGSNAEVRRASVKDGNTVVHNLGEYKQGDYDAQNAISEAGKLWLNQHFPQWENPLAHWD